MDLRAGEKIRMDQVLSPFFAKAFALTHRCRQSRIFWIQNSRLFHKWHLSSWMPIPDAILMALDRPEWSGWVE